MPANRQPPLGASYQATTKTLRFRVYAKNASRLELCLFDQAQGAGEVRRLAMVREAGGDTWALSLPWAGVQAQGLVGPAVYYGFRAWGPNWPYDPSWRPGTEIGFGRDVDDQGHRFNPNKLLLDPYGREISHDPEPRLSDIDPNEYRDDYYSGPGCRQLDTAPIAPKSVFVRSARRTSVGQKPRRSLKDDIIYEVHLRGLTRADHSLPADCRGTYKGAGLKAGYLKELGVTAVEFLPVHHFASEQNDDQDPRGDNYWGYMTLGYFAPNRRYAADRSPGGPTREFKEMVRAFHDAGLKVLLDVVYNHTAEGLLKRATDRDDSRQDDGRQFPDRACLLSFRGLDNASHYTLRSRLDLDPGPNRRYQDNSACGASLNVRNGVVRDFILDSLRYWSEEMGVDGFRFDLAPVLGNARAEGGFEFDRAAPDNVLNRMLTELPLRDPETLVGVDLIAEPWAPGSGDTYQLGRFPDGWAEWNDVFRTVFRQAENKLHVVDLPPWRLANGLAGSDQQFRNSSPRRDPRPYQSINYLASHDGYTLRDAFSYSKGHDAWDHGGRVAAQRQAVRNAFALLLLAAGTPMFTGGDELFRTLNGRDNVVAVDDASVYLDWTSLLQYQQAIKDNDQGALARLRQMDAIRIYDFVRNLLHFRQGNSCLRPARYFTGQAVNGGLKDICWLRQDGQELAGLDWNDPNRAFLAWRLDNRAQATDSGVASIYVAYNRDDRDTDLVLPANLSGRRWSRVADTDEWMEGQANFDDGATLLERTYRQHGRSVLILVER